LQSHLIFENALSWVSYSVTDILHQTLIEDQPSWSKRRIVDLAMSEIISGREWAL